MFPPIWDVRRIPDWRCRDFHPARFEKIVAMYPVSRVIDEFKLDLPLHALFLSPTIADMSTIIMQHQDKKPADSDLEKTLTEIESMSDDEAQGILSADKLKP